MLSIAGVLDHETLHRPMTGWGLSMGNETLIGRVVIAVSKVWGDAHDPRVSVSVGRPF